MRQNACFLPCMLRFVTSYATNLHKMLNSNSNSTFIALNLCQKTDSKAHHTKTFFFFFFFFFLALIYFIYPFAIKKKESREGEGSKPSIETMYSNFYIKILLYIYIVSI